MNKIVEYYSTTCAPCKMMIPVLEKISKQYAISLEKKDIDIYKKDIEKFNINKVPTILLIKDEEVIETIVGTISLRELEKKVKNLL